VKVLIVDDDAAARGVLRRLLSRLGIEDVEEAGDGSAALACLREARFDLVVSDWNMEPMNGIDLLRAVRADAALAGVAFVMLTAEERPENVVAARTCGASAYLVKPVDAERLRAGIAAALTPRRG
jgi:two-component system chemotaxis response regulator CheY